jgi:hypothetical protein
MTLQYKLLFIVGVILLSGCSRQGAVTAIPPELQALRDQHGGATNWLECQHGIIVDVYTKYLDHNFMPRVKPLEQNGNIVRCDVDFATVQAVEVSKDE